MCVPIDFYEIHGDGGCISMTLSEGIARNIENLPEDRRAFVRRSINGLLEAELSLIAASLLANEGRDSTECLQFMSNNKAHLAVEIAVMLFEPK
ncbi:MAG: hypothetical protein AB199_03785 [Parcubacteria bacterium C7867-004]|nr:MAG: hypothetical protein AB199_03785 [Parcubacteria bacterium C7867-004]